MIEFFKKKRKSGWYEDKGPLTEKAPIHQEVAMEQNRQELMNMGKSRIVPSQVQVVAPEPSETCPTCRVDIEDVTFRLELENQKHVNFLLTTEKFAIGKQDKDDGKITPPKITFGDGIVTIRMKPEYINDFIEYIEANGFKLDDDKKKGIWGWLTG